MTDDVMGAKLLSGSVPADIVEAAAIIRAGGLVAVPTDTVYGLAASVWQPAAVARPWAQHASQVTLAVRPYVPGAV